MPKDKEPPDQDRGKIKSLHVELPEDFHRRVKMLCVLQGVTLKDYASTALEEKVARDEASIKSTRNGK